MNAQHNQQLINPRRRNIPVLSLRATRLWIVGICAFAFCSISLVAAAQNTQDEETTRKLWDTAFSTTRRKPARSGRNTAGRGNYRVATPRISPAGVSGDSVVGVTVWRMRPAREADEGERIIVHEGSDAATWIPERVPANAGLAEGDRVRLSIEAARTG